MFDKDIYFLQRKALDLRKSGSDPVSVYISVHSPDLPEAFKLFEDIHRSYVTGMPDLIARIKMMKNTIIKIAMSIRKQSYLEHILFPVKNPYKDVH